MYFEYNGIIVEINNRKFWEIQGCVKWSSTFVNSQWLKRRNRNGNQRIFLDEVKWLRGVFKFREFRRSNSIWKGIYD